MRGRDRGSGWNGIKNILYLFTCLVWSKWKELKWFRVSLLVQEMKRRRTLSRRRDLVPLIRQSIIMMSIIFCRGLSLNPDIYRHGRGINKLNVYLSFDIYIKSYFNGRHWHIIHSRLCPRMSLCPSRHLPGKNKWNNFILNYISRPNQVHRCGEEILTMAIIRRVWNWIAVINIIRPPQ